MKIIKISLDGLKAAQLKEAVGVLKKGGTVVFPTDTAYGLAADATNHKAIARVYEIKTRAFTKPLPIIVGNLNQMKEVVILNAAAKQLAHKFWPGPLTLVLPKKASLPPDLTSGLPKVALRWPKNKVAQQLAQELGRPITSTSANISGAGNSYSAEKIVRLFKRRESRPDLIIHAGTLRRVRPSTIIDLTVKPYKILRRGPISPEQIKNVLREEVI